MGNYLRINDKENAVDSLLRAEEYICRAEKHTRLLQDDGICWGAFHWKWVIICLQHSLYTFALTVAAGTNPGIVQRKKGGVVDLITALKLCIGVKRFYHSLPIELTLNQKNSILWLHRHFRNNFEHFQPNLSWSISLEGIPNICIDVLETIKLLALDSKNISYASLYYEQQEKEKKIEASINKSIWILKSSKFYDPNNEIGESPELEKLWEA